MRTSYVQERGEVDFPEFTGERVYMRDFKQADGLPSDLARWQPTVDQMLAGIKTNDSIFLMIDQGIVEPGMTHRRPGIHVDGVWLPDEKMHGGGRHSTEPRRPPGHRNDPPVEDEPPEVNPHVGDDDQVPGRRLRHQGLILASSVFGAMGYNGTYCALPNKDGSFDDLDLGKLCAMPMWPGSAYAGDALTMLHESIEIPRRCQRTLVRLNVVGWTPDFPKKRDFLRAENWSKLENGNSTRRQTGILRSLAAHARRGS